MERVIIFGLGELAELVYHYLYNDPNYSVVGFTADHKFIKHDTLFGLPIVPFENIEVVFPPDEFKMFVAIGYSQTNRLRAKKFQAAQQKGYLFATYIHPRAFVSEQVLVGNNCMILEGSIIQPFVEIGNGVLIWSGCHIGHHSTISDHCFIAPRAALSGHVRLEERVFIGINATIRDGIKIAEETIVGAGTVILENTNPNEIYKAVSANKLEISSKDLNKI